ncbi:MAG: hypothetical protein R2737_16080 [Candidatus Nanopelagicales bacterium]
MRTLRIIGLLMFAYGAVMLVLLATPARDWALDHSIARYVSLTDRRVNNVVDTADLPMAIAGSAVVMFAGAWIGLLVPWVMKRNTGRMRAQIEADLQTPSAGTPRPDQPA